MAERKVGQLTKSALELGPILLFFVGYMRYRDDAFTFGGVEYSGFIAVTAAFIPILLVSSGILWWLTGKLSRMQVVTAILVVVFGGLSIWFNDERFFKVKPTIVYLLFAMILIAGLLRGKSAVQFVMDEAMPLTDEGWMVLTRRLAGLFLFLAVANEVVWRTMSTDAWVTVKTFGFPGAFVVFFVANTYSMQKHYLAENAEKGN